MFTRLPSGIVVVVFAAVIVTACSDSTSSPASPSAVPFASSGSSQTADSASPPSTTTAAGGRGQSTVTMMDACDPQTFNAALGAGTCVRNGGVTLDKFLELLGKHHFVGSWHFAPPQVHMEVGDTLVARNHGGETHTFTEVEAFGGGIVPQLNQLTGLTTVAPECNLLQAGDFIPAGGSSSEVEDEAGVEKYQCCIHPWMRAEVRVGSR
jgi:plastocyanin